MLESFFFEGGLSRQSELQSRKAFGRGPAGGCIRRGGRTWASLTTQDAIQCIHYKSPCPNGQGVGLLIRRCSLAQSCHGAPPGRSSLVDFRPSRVDFQSLFESRDSDCTRANSFEAKLVASPCVDKPHPSIRNFPASVVVTDLP